MIQVGTCAVANEGYVAINTAMLISIFTTCLYSFI